MIFAVNPLCDPRWGELVARDAHATIFHTRGWIDALHRTYGYEPVAYTTSPPGVPLSNGVVFCEIRSWLTGARLVSLPFSDHCDPLTHRAEEAEAIVQCLEKERRSRGWRYVELRPRRMKGPAPSGFGESEEYWLHEIDLRRSSGALFASFHRSSVQRKIRRAERENLQYVEGCGEQLLVRFHQLVALTRQRQGLPPQPLCWFRNLVACLGPAVKIRIASYANRPIGGILTLRHRDTMVYKYGASDPAFHPMGGMQFLLWQAIQEAQADGCALFDLGRSNVHQPGLITFKDHWGATRTRVTYFRSPAPAPQRGGQMLARLTVHARRAFELAPGVLRSAAGRLLYRHVG